MVKYGTPCVLKANGPELGADSLPPLLSSGEGDLSMASGPLSLGYTDSGSYDV